MNRILVLAIILVGGWNLALCAKTHAAEAKAGQVPKAGEVIKDCPECPEMVVIPAGVAIIGAELSEREHEGILNNAGRESPRHVVTISRPFALGRTEITRALYGRFVQETQRTGPPECAAPGNPETPGIGASLPVTKTWKSPGFVQNDNEPVVCVSWEDAKAMVAWLSQKTGKSYRLPSEAEWEYAARGGTTTARYWGDSAKQICRRANMLSMATVQAMGATAGAGALKDELICNSDHKFTMPVASFEPNPFGLYDMIGNVWELVEDCFHPNYLGAPIDGSAWQEPNCLLRVQRGGAFNNIAWFGRAATRGTIAFDRRGTETGFRVGRDLD
jgi:formylglycine-generating enzyme required for sulfatase activity